MRPFKFFQKEKIVRVLHNHRQYLGTQRGQLKWMTEPVGIIYYMEASSDTPEGYGGIPTISMELKSESVVANGHNIISYNEFIELNQSSYIFAYSFMDFNDGSIYTEDTFHLMPRDIRLLFRGVIKY